MEFGKINFGASAIGVPFGDANTFSNIGQTSSRPEKTADQIIDDLLSLGKKMKDYEASRWMLISPDGEVYSVGNMLEAVRVFASKLPNECLYVDVNDFNPGESAADLKASDDSEAWRHVRKVPW